MYARVSVPLQGTYLLYLLNGKLGGGYMRFRPLTGDLSSLLKSMKIEDVVDLTFPSPYRGLIFFTNMKNSVKKENKFPSPYRGLIFFTGYYDTARKINKMFPSPYRGLIFFTRYNVHEEREIRFPSPYRGLIFFTVYLEWSFSGQGFPSPYRGLIFLT